MTYSEIFRGSLLGSDEVFHLALDGKAKTIMLFNISVLGILFGLSNLALKLRLTPDFPISGKFAIITPCIYSVAGIVTMFGAAVGLCLIYWAAAKAFGGPGGFSLILDLIGVSAIPFWILAPLANYALRLQETNTASLLFLIPAMLSFSWSFKLLRQSLVIGQGITPDKATAAVICMWIFSISSVYVFLP